MAFSYIRSTSNLMKTVAAMTFQEGHGHRGSLVTLSFLLQKGKETETEDLQTKMNRELKGKQRRTPGGQSALRRERKMWVDGQWLRLGLG